MSANTAQQKGTVGEIRRHHSGSLGSEGESAFSPSQMKMLLLDLPNELLLSVVDFLKERDISTFARTNRRLYPFLNAYLYRHNAQHSNSSALLWAVERGRETTAQMSLR